MTKIQMADTGHEPDTATKQDKTTNNSITYEDIMNNTITEKNSQESSNKEKMDNLKSLLPSILSCTALKKESSTSYSGACPKCGGNDRFVYKTDSERCWCRQCKPESDAMDIIAFHCWKDNKSVSDLMREYLPKTYTQTKQEVDINTEWQIIMDGLNPPHFDKISFAKCETLLKARGISDATIKALYNEGKIRGTIRHRRAETVAVAYTPLNIAGQEVNAQETTPLAIQYLTVNQKPFYKMEKNKSFHKGSKAGGLCFFQCGKPITDPETKGIVIVEGVINAITGMDIMPEYTWLAIGGSEFIKKVEALKHYAQENQGTINNGISVICAFDNDPAGKKASLKIGRLLKDINNCIFEIQFTDNTPGKFDLNDYIRMDKDPTRTPQPEAIIDLINNAKIIVDESPPKTDKVKVDTAQIFQETESKVYPDNDTEKSKVYLIAGKQPEALNKCQDILNDDGCIYQRGKTLFRITQEEPKPREGIKAGGSFHLQEITPLWLKNKLNKIATFISFKVDKKTGDVEEIIKDCPRDLAESILANSGSWPFSYITGVCETPTLRADGTLINKRGYDSRTGLYMAIDNDWTIPENPTREDAIKAYDKLNYVIKDFEFTDEESRTTAISAMLTGTVRRLLPTAPAFCFDAPKRGSGKTLLADTIGGIITGEAITTINQGRDETEFSKRIDSIIFRGDPIINIDNIEVPVSGDTINSILTSELYNPRVLGKSEVPRCETNILIMFTGNNVVFKGDMVRRILISRIDPQCENPEDRTFDIDLRKYARDNRRELVTAALTIIRAYHAAGAPRQPVKNYGSFEQWCEFARYPLIWIGKTDPIKSRDKVKDSDPVTGNLKELLAAWHGVYGKNEKTVKEVAEDVRTKFNNKPLTEAENRLIDIVELIAVDDKGTVNNRRFGNFVAKYRDRFEGEFRFVESGNKNNIKKYYVEKMATETNEAAEIHQQEDSEPEDEHTECEPEFDFNTAEKQTNHDTGKVNCSLCKRLYDSMKCKNGKARQLVNCDNFMPLSN